MLNKTERVVYFNGEFIPESQAKVSIYDSALMFGDMVFEMTRSFNKKQFKLREHLERLYKGLHIFRIPIIMTIEEMEKACYETIEANDHLFSEDDEHRLLIDVTRGTLGLYQEVLGTHKGPNVIIADFPLRWTVKGMGKLFDEGINLMVPSQRQIPAHLLDPKIKNRSRIHYLMANIQVSQNTGENNWALLLDENGYITEGTGSNILFIKENNLYSPRTTNILKGISRDYIIQNLCDSVGLNFIEKDIDLYEAYEADEIFMTATPFCILPAVSLNGLKIGSGLMGDYTKKLIDLWSKNVGVDIIGQIKGWDKQNIEAFNAPTPYQFKKA